MIFYVGHVYTLAKSKDQDVTVVQDDRTTTFMATPLTISFLPEVAGKQSFNDTKDHGRIVMHLWHNVYNLVLKEPMKKVGEDG